MYPRLFFPVAKAYSLYQGEEELWRGRIHVLPVEKFLANMPETLK